MSLIKREHQLGYFHLHCKLKLTINTNQVKMWYLRSGETGVPGENLSVRRREPTNSTHI